ncbi:hypothetical protein P389DRAFT_192568 [Cystobasidium minutum MCA 4210]|uniref:uncharacterized protein n=1 Tax=Cystobasidium minutum MCA 4210 TaxID=1397322 RepID=UPI0034CD96F8|eukprot:jgi/Rhomi1/192568/gm1.782_g
MTWVKVNEESGAVPWFPTKFEIPPDFYFGTAKDNGPPDGFQYRPIRAFLEKFDVKSATNVGAYFDIMECIVDFKAKAEPTPHFYHHVCAKTLSEKYESGDGLLEAFRQEYTATHYNFYISTDWAGSKGKKRGCESLHTRFLIVRRPEDPGWTPRRATRQLADLAINSELITSEPMVSRLQVTKPGTVQIWSLEPPDADQYWYFRKYDTLDNAARQHQPSKRVPRESTTDYGKSGSRLFSQRPHSLDFEYSSGLPSSSRAQKSELHPNALKGLKHPVSGLTVTDDHDGRAPHRYSMPGDVEYIDAEPGYLSNHEPSRPTSRLPSPLPERRDLFRTRSAREGAQVFSRPQKPVDIRDSDEDTNMLASKKTYNRNYRDESKFGDSSVRSLDRHKVTAYRQSADHVHNLNGQNRHGPLPLQPSQRHQHSTNSGRPGQGESGYAGGHGRPLTPDCYKDAQPKGSYLSDTSLEPGPPRSHRHSQRFMPAYGTQPPSQTFIPNSQTYRKPNDRPRLPSPSPAMQQQRQPERPVVRPRVVVENAEMTRVEAYESAVPEIYQTGPSHSYSSSRYRYRSSSSSSLGRAESGR